MPSNPHTVLPENRDRDRPPPAYPAAAFDYHLPPGLIAQQPLPDRTASRLLVLDRRTGATTHRTFHDLPSLLEAGDVLVLNTSRVIPARLRGSRDNGREAEVLLVHPEPDGCWLALVHPGGKLKPGRIVRFGDDATAEVTDALGGGLRRVRFSGRTPVRDLMNRYGTTPLPPYIRRPAAPEDRERYQTVFAREEGSVAAPTAGLHFTDELLNAIRARGIVVSELVLHVGPGTFKPVEVADLITHPMHPEWFAIPPATSQAVAQARAGGHRVVAVGTTVARALETAAANGGVEARSGTTGLFIYPPYRFRVVDALITNFHLPRSTLLMLVAAFAGYDQVMAAYREAVRQGYRFYSYGDAMLVR
jgi:S-adenosylmethionine:tRNA ribosyltransferase-isomerase